MRNAFCLEFIIYYFGIFPKVSFLTLPCDRRRCRWSTVGKTKNPLGYAGGFLETGRSVLFMSARST